MDIRQFITSYVLSLGFLFVVVALVKTRRLDIAYCWLWLGLGICAPLVVLKYDWLVLLSSFMGSETPTTTLFLVSILLLFLISFRLSLIVSEQRRQIKKLSQQLAMQSHETSM